MTLIINPRNKQQEKVVRAFLSSLNIGFHTEAEEDAAFVNAMQRGKKTPLLNKILPRRRSSPQAPKS